MNVEEECQKIKNIFKTRPFSLGMLDDQRKIRGEPPFSKKERMILVSCLERRYGVKKSYQHNPNLTHNGFLTLFSFPEQTESVGRAK